MIWMRAAPRRGRERSAEDRVGLAGRVSGQGEAGDAGGFVALQQTAKGRQSALAADNAQLFAGEPARLERGRGREEPHQAGLQLLARAEGRLAHQFLEAAEWLAALAGLVRGGLSYEPGDVGFFGRRGGRGRGCEEEADGEGEGSQGIGCS